MPSASNTRLRADIARRLAGVALRNVGNAYPYHLAHLLHSADELRPPHAVHPVFWGSYDWHSCVHMHWTLARCLRLAARDLDTAAVEAHCTARLTPAAVQGELAYVTAPGRASFERPYGWGWLLKLAG